MEKNIEQNLKIKIEKLGGKYFKLQCAGRAGMPDRLVLLPNAKVYFVELKDKGKKPRPLLKYMLQELEKLGFLTFCIYDVKAIKSFIEAVK